MIFPPNFTHPEKKIAVSIIAAKVIAALAPSRRVVVQAGGCSGLWPLALAQHFRRVITFEPEPNNYTCLRENTKHVSNILAHNCGLGEERKRVGLTRPREKAGLWTVDGEGEIEILPVDYVFDFITNLDALVLDVEGSELSVLRGAEQAIAANHPLLWFEYLHNTEPIDRFLESHGYLPAIRGIGKDCYSVHASARVH